MLIFTNDGYSERKTSPTATPFWPQRDLSYGVTTGSLAADRTKDIADSFSHALRMVFEGLARFKVAFNTLSTAVLAKENCFAEVAG